MAFKSFLKAVGQDFKKGLDYALKLEPAVEVGLSIADPPVAALLHLTTATILSVEQKFAAMGSQSGSGAQKSAQVIQILEPTIKSILAPYGVTVDTEYIQKYIDSIVAVLNLLPAIPAPAATATVAKVAVAQIPAPAQSAGLSPAPPQAGPDPVLNSAG
jgi:hypothetical protein